MLNVNLTICIWYFALFSSQSVSCILHFLFHRNTHTEMHSAVCFIHPCIRSVHRLCITQSCILHSVYCTQGQRHAHSEAAISQTALQETWLNLPPPAHLQFLWWWRMVMMILKLVIIAAMMMVVNDCWCHMVKYSISTTMIVVFTLIPGIEDTTTRHHDMQSLSKWQLVLCLGKKFSGDWWFIVHNI